MAAHDFQDDIDAINGIASISTILDVICRTTGMGFAAVARVTEDRWIACKVQDSIAFGLESGGELAISTTICNEIRDSKQLVVIDEVATDSLYCGHPTPLLYGFQSYISMPIVRRDGSFFGTLCAIDPRPARLTNPETIGMFKLFAELISTQLDTAHAMVNARAQLVEQDRLSELRDQFIAILGHDLRNPIASVAAGANLLLRSPLDAKSEAIVKLMQGSVVRMSGLVDNVLDFARARLGDGIKIERKPTNVGPILVQVIDELRAVHPGRVVETEIELHKEVGVDALRFAQLFSNLLANAMTHGAPDAPVRVSCAAHGDALELSVANAGKPIPASDIGGLFLPFSRGGSGRDGRGLGLGLYIAAEIAKAHGGRLTVSSTENETRFVVSIPLGTRGE